MTPTIESVTFACEGYEYQGEQAPGRLRVWLTPGGDALALYFFPAPPDLPADAQSLDDLDDFYQPMLASAQGKIVESRLGPLDGLTSLEMLVSLPQPPSGRVYVGSTTIPLRDCSFVFKVECPEHGATGAKEALLTDRELSSGADPDQLNCDDSRFDSEFPDHPVARARAVLGAIASSVKIAEDLRGCPAFPLPSV